MKMNARPSILTAAALATCLCLCPGDCVASETLVPLVTEMATFPKGREVYDCAPFETKVQPCDPEPLEAPVIRVPEHTLNLSKGKPVTSSDENPVIGDLQCLTDGGKVLGGGEYVELREGLQWVQIDLGHECDISVIWIWHHFDSLQKTYKIAYRDVIVRISNDGQFEDGVHTVFNNDRDNSANLGQGTDKAYIETRFGKPIVLGKPIKGRYVRLYSNGNDRQETNSYLEVEVFGTSGPAAEP